jgi:hypothetical protein
MNRLKRFLLSALLIFLINLSVNSQSNSPYTPKIIPPSPNAASLGKFGDIPVSPYTGTADISVPVYTIQAKGISVPVNLSYHSGGTRLAEEAGWAGLSWALNAGGMISRKINDKDDFSGGYYNADMGAFTPFPEIKGKLVPRILYPNEIPMGPWGYAFTCRYKVYTELNTFDLYNAIEDFSAAPAVYDLEPDSYSFNFPGRSGKFIIGRDRTVVLQKQENLKIQFANDGSSFTITDEQGNKYYFLDKEYNQPAIGGAQHISSWLLSKVVTQQKDSVMFNYYSDNTWTTVKGINHESDRRGMSGYEGTTYANDPGQSYLNKTLLNIDYANAQLQFSFDGSRTDVQGGKKLNNIKIYSKDQAGLKYLKEQQLFYSYFNNGVGDALGFQRLRLDSIKEVSGTSTMPSYVFSYNMPATMQNLMGKRYSSVDHWGYFNGKSNAVAGNNELGFLPPFLGIASVGGSNSTVLLDLAGANRDPDALFMNAFSLNRVTYPTGGYTLLDYEPNYYDYNNSISGSGGKDFEYIATVNKTAQFIINTNGASSGSIDFSKIFYTCPINSLTGQPIGTNGTLAIAFRAAGSDSLNKYHNTFSFGKINFTFQNNITDIISSSLYCNGTVTNGNCSGTVYSASLPLSITAKTVYPWSAYIDPAVSIPGGLQDIVITFTWKEALFSNSTMLMGGGLRVKTITDYTASGKVAKKRTYDYGYQQDRNGDGMKETYSYGRLMGYLSYARYEVLDISSTVHGTNFTRYSSSNSAFTSQSSGNIVGYDQVTEYTIDPETAVDAGKTIYTYNNSSDTAYSYAGYRFPGVPNLPNNLNGLPASKSVFAKAGAGYKRVSSSDYHYHTANRVIYDCMKYLHFDNLVPNAVLPITCYAPGAQACDCPQQIDSTGWSLMANFYPAISSEVILLDSTVEKTFDQADTTIQLKVVTKNFYDNPKHYQLTRASITDSKNNTTTGLIKYPQDYIPNGFTVTGNTILDSLISKNMLGATIEKRDSFYLSGSSTGSVKGAQLSVYKLLSPTQSIGLDKQYNLDVQAPVTNFQGFAINNNVTSQDSRYRQMISFDSYDNANNILQYTSTDQLPMSIIWDYNNIYPVAEVKKAFSTGIANTSFEADGKGNWTFTGTATTDATSPTGAKCYNLGQASGNITKSGLLSTTIYTVSYWRKTATPLTITGTQSGYPTQGKTIDGWTYFEHKITGQTSITISGTNFIDELRLYPFNALMTTYTYTPLVGISSSCDADNRITYYYYDEFMRLKWIKDQDKNIIKTFRYHYLNQVGPN